MNLILRPMGTYGRYFFGITDAGYRTVPLADVVRIGKYNTKGHGDYYCVELTDGAVGRLALVDNDAATLKLLRPYLTRVPIPGGLRLPPELVWGPPMSEPIAPKPTLAERRAAMLARRSS